MHSGPITCLAFTDDQLIISASSLGSVTVSSLSSDQRVALLKPSTAPTGDLLYAWARMNTFGSSVMCMLLISCYKCIEHCMLYTS